MAEGRAQCFTADSAQKLGSQNNVDKRSTQQSDRSKYPVKTITLILDFNSFITLGQIGIWETFYTMIQFPERLLIIEPGLVLATVPATQQEEKRLRDCLQMFRKAANSTLLGKAFYSLKNPT